MISPPTITVIIPAFNAAGFIDCAIQSALAQTVPPLEILVVDDGSTDNTAAIVGRYSAPVRLLTQSNAGPASARNSGAKEARGEWLALLDADDTWLPEKLERQVAYTGDVRAGAIHCFAVGDHPRARCPERIIFSTLWQRNYVANSSVLLRRTALEQVGGFDEDRALISVEDYNCWLRLAAAGWDIVTCPEALWHYSPAPGNLSSQLERFALAELTNLDKIGKLLALDEGMIHKKRIALYEEYGRELLHYGQSRAARQLLFKAIKCKPSLLRLVWWLAAYVPRPILDLRRSHLKHLSLRGTIQLGPRT